MIYSARLMKVRFSLALMVSAEPNLPKSWEEEVQEILQRAGDLEGKKPRSGGGLGRRAGFGIGNPLTAIGDQIFKRLATPKDMAVSGALLIAAAVVLSATPLGRMLSPVLAVIGGILLVGAYVRSLMQSRSTASPGPKMWRGRVIEIEQPRQRGILDRIFGRRHRPK